MAHFVRLTVVCIALLSFAARANGQAEVSTDAEVANTAAVELANQLKLIEADAELDPTAKARAVESYKQAIAATDAAAGFEAKRKDFEQRIASVETETRSISGQLSQPVKTVTVESTSLTLQELDSAVQQKAAEVESQRQIVAGLNDAIAARETRLVELPQLIAEATTRNSEVENAINATVPAGEPQKVTVARQVMLDKKREAIRREIEALKQENAWHLANGELLPLQRDLEKRNLDIKQAELDKWQQAATAKRETEVDRAIRKAEAAVKAAPESVRTLFLENLVTAQVRRETESRLITATAEQQALQDKLTKLDQQFTRTQNEAQTQSTITDTVGAVLRQQRNELPSVQSLLRSSKARQRQISEIRLKLFLLREEHSQLTDLAAETQAKLDELGLSDEAADDVREDVRKALENRSELLSGLVTDTNALFQMLAKLDGTETSLMTLTDRYESFIDERVFWIRSTEPFGPKQIGESFEVITSLAQPGEWTSLPRLLGSHLRRHFILPVICLVVFVPIFVLRLRIQHAISEYGAKAESRSCRDFGLTLRTTMLTLGISILWPSFLYLLGLWLKNDALSMSELVGPLSVGLMAAAAVLLPLEVWRKASRSKGLIESHFGVEHRLVTAIRIELRWLTFTLVPLVGIVAAIQSFENLLYERSVGRVVFVLAMLSLLIFVYRVLHPKGTAFQAFIGRRSESPVHRTRHFWFPAFLAIPIALAILSLLGYHFTAVHLANRLQWTCFLILTLSFLYALALRWIVLSRRRLAMEQARARLAKTSEKGDASPSSLEAQANLQTIDLSSVDLQTRRLVRAISVVVGAIALWSLWADVLPALSVFDNITAWNIEVPTVVQTTVNGETTMQPATTVKMVSYADVFIASLIMIGMLLAMRDVPGLLELVLLQHLPLDVALRFAMTTLTRYVIFIVGLVWAFGTIEIGWSKVQWLVAAVSVGLGFGLQEIFANFVSGLIILFERPLRAGDIVTIDGVTGTVKNVRLRATIIQDLDRKDFIVPNKDFITGRLLNWTLSDEVSRIVINVGVAYGSDTEKAKSLMLAAAQNHPLIAKDPPAQVTFEAFGDSSLNLVLRCFISLQNMPGRMRIVDELHTEIDRSFHTSSIEIPFPQRDLHLRSIDTNSSKLLVDSNNSDRGSTK